MSRCVGTDAMARLDLQSHDPAVGGLEQPIDLGAVVLAVVVERRGHRRPSELLAQLEPDEGLDERSADLGHLRPTGVRDVEEGRGEAGVAHEQLRAPSDPLAGVRAPRGHVLEEEQGVERMEVPSQRARGEARRPRELGEVRRSSAAGSHQPSEPREVGQLGEVGDVVDVPLQGGRQVGVEPGAAPVGRRARHGGREAALQHALGEVLDGTVRRWCGVAERPRGEVLPNTLEFALGERTERSDLDAPGESIAVPRKREDVGRAGHQEAPRAPVAVHGGLDGQEQVRRALDLVDRHRAGRPGDQRGRVRLGPFEDVEVVQGPGSPAGALGGDAGDERALARLARADDRDDGRVVEGLLHTAGEPAGSERGGFGHGRG